VDEGATGSTFLWSDPPVRVLAGRDLAAEAKLALKMALASSLGWWLATLAGQPRPVFAALVGLVALSGDPYSAFAGSAARVLGVFVGVTIGIGLLQLDLRILWLVALGLMLGTLAGIPLRVGDRPNVQVAVSVLFVIGLGRSGALHAGVARLWETAIGAGATLLVAIAVWPPHPVRQLEATLERLRQELAADLAAVAEELATRSGAVPARLDEVREHSLDAVREFFALEQRRRALRLNPLRRRDAPQVAALERRISLAGRLYRHARSLARDVADSTVQDERLAAAARAVAEAADLALRGEPAEAALRAAADALSAAPDAGEAFLIRSQLRQMLADLQIV
jgi:uncharacterized membrane protein YgaE (UPF0421/DUF939 family)